MKIIKQVILSLFCAGLLVSCNKKNDAEYFESMDTFMKVRCYGKDSEAANKEAQERISFLEKLISVTKNESEIFAINNAAGKPVTVSDETISVIKDALKMAEKSDGAFNPCLYPVSSEWGFTTKKYRIPSDDEINELLKLTDFRKVKIDGNSVSMEKGMKLDLGGIGKGFAGDEAIKVLQKYGIQSALLDLGGNIQTIGKKPDGSLWTVGVKNPWDEGVVASLKLNNEAAITSGGYVRFFIGDDGKKYIHIFDGKTGRPVETDIASATIVCEKGTYGDALSTTTYVLGKEKACQFWKENKDFQMILLYGNNSICYTDGLKGKITLMHEFDNVEIIK